MRFEAGRAEAAVRELLIAMREHPDRPGVRNTPARPASTTSCPFTGSRTSATSPVRTPGVIGLSPLARLVEVHARRPQVQERMASHTADALDDVLRPGRPRRHRADHRQQGLSTAGAGNRRTA